MKINSEYPALLRSETANGMDYGGASVASRPFVVVVSLGRVAELILILQCCVLAGISLWPFIRLIHRSTINNSRIQFTISPCFRFI